MSGAVLCMVFPSVLDSQNKRQRWCQVRRRVTGDDPRTDRNDDEKGVETFLVARVVVFLLGPPSVFLVPGLVLVCPCLPGSGSWAGFREKGRRPKNRSFRFFARERLFQVFLGMLALLRGTVTIYSPSYRYRQYGSPCAFDPPPRVERALRGGCASFSFLLVDLSPLRWCSRSMSQVVSHRVPPTSSYYLDRDASAFFALPLFLCKSSSIRRGLGIRSCLADGCCLVN